MKYTVTWVPDAEQELANLWVNSEARAAVTQAAYIIDQDLRHNPEEVGESRGQELRIHFVPPLGVLFRVQTNTQLVEVIHVWEFA